MKKTLTTAVCAAALLAGPGAGAAWAEGPAGSGTYQGQIQFGAPPAEALDGKEDGDGGAATGRKARGPIDVSSLCRKIGDRKEIAMRDCLTMMSFLLLQLAARGNVQIPLQQPEKAEEPQE